MGRDFLYVFLRVFSECQGQGFSFLMLFIVIALKITLWQLDHDNCQSTTVKLLVSIFYLHLTAFLFVYRDEMIT